MTKTTVKLSAKEPFDIATVISAGALLLILVLWMFDIIHGATAWVLWLFVWGLIYYNCSNRPKLITVLLSLSFFGLLGLWLCNMIAGFWAIITFGCMVMVFRDKTIIRK